MKIGPSETEIIGEWLWRDGKIVGDENCERVALLVREHLEEIAINPECGAWETLFLDPHDGRYWERTYLQGERHGGGPHSLILLSKEDAEAKYKIHT